MKVAAVIVGAGFGKRIGKAKAAILLEGKPLFYYSLKTFLNCKAIGQVILVLQKKHFKIAKNFIDNKKVTLTAGGQTRKQSVINGLEKVREGIDFILIHDCARPFLKKQLILKVIKELKNYPAVIPGIKVKDTLKQVQKGLVKKTLNRENILSIQTPQGFRKNLLKSEYKKHKHLKITDSAKIFEKAGHPVKIVEGDRLNFKITYKEDIFLAKRIKKYERI